jgi:hypothetical protein
MTTGCACPTCSGTTSERNTPCRLCQLERGQGLGNAVRLALHRALIGDTRGAQRAGWSADREAGS